MRQCTTKYLRYTACVHKPSVMRSSRVCANVLSADRHAPAAGRGKKKHVATSIPRLTPRALPVHKMCDKEPPQKRDRTKKSSSRCSRCGGEGHISQECPNPCGGSNEQCCNEKVIPTALIGSIVKPSEMTPDVVVEALRKAHTNTTGAVDVEMGYNTRLVIEHTIPLVKAGDARGKQQALVVFALLVGGVDHPGHRDKMKKLREAVVPPSPEALLPPLVAAPQFQAFLATFAPCGTEAAALVEQASTANIYDTAGLEKLIPRKRVNILQYLEERGMLS